MRSGQVPVARPNRSQPQGLKPFGVGWTARSPVPQKLTATLVRMRLRVWIWTFGLAFVGYALGGRGASASPARETIGAILGAIVGFGVGWGLQRLLERGRRR